LNSENSNENQSFFFPVSESYLFDLTSFDPILAEGRITKYELMKSVYQIYKKSNFDKDRQLIDEFFDICELAGVSATILAFMG